MMLEKLQKLGKWERFCISGLSNLSNLYNLPFALLHWQRTMSQLLQRISAALFYLLAGSFFVSYLLFRNELWLPWSLWWMKVADLPLALIAALYGGASLYRSVKQRDGLSWPLLILIGLPLLALFTFLVALNFWNVLGLPQSSSF